MPSFSVQTMTSQRVEEFLSLEGDAAKVEHYRQRLASGKLSAEQMFILHVDGVPAAHYVVGRGRAIFPQADTSLSDEALRFLGTHLLSAAGSAGKLPILDSTLFPLTPGPLLQVGWTLSHHARLYETDLTARSFAAWDAVQELTRDALSGGEFTDFLHALIAADGAVGDLSGTDLQALLPELQGDENARFFVSREAGELTGLATLTPAPAGRASIHLLGVRPSHRQQGVGQRLHAHLLKVAATFAHTHAGGTDAGNTAMQRIYAANGARMTAEQVQLRSRA